MSEQTAGPGRRARVFWQVQLSALVVAVSLVFVGCERGGDEVAEDGGAAADSIPTVTLAQFAQNPMQRAHQILRLQNLPVASKMGAHAFWIQLPNEVAYLIRFDSTLIGQGQSVASGDTVTVVGRVHPMSDSVMAAWERQGTIADEGQKAEAQFAMSFLEASQLTKTGSAAR